METKSNYSRVPVLFGIGVALSILLFGWSKLSFAENETIGTIDRAMLSAEQAHAQQIAVEGRDIHTQQASERADVFHVFPLPTFQQDGVDLCSAQTCYQVDIYLWDSNTSLSAIVNIEQSRLLDVIRYEDTQPLFSEQLATHAKALLKADDGLTGALGYVPEDDGIALMDGEHGGAPGCDGSELCLAAVFVTDSGTIWAIVNLTHDEVARVWWEDRPIDLENNELRQQSQSTDSSRQAPTDCNSTLTHSQDGWALSYGQSNTDGLHAWNISYLGTPIADSIKVAEWHVDYTVQKTGTSFPTGFIDANFCTSTRERGSQFPIFAVGDPEIRPIVISTTATTTETVGFEVVQDYRQSGWAFLDCKYRYEQHYQFFTDGRWRVVTSAYGRGCGNNALEEAVYRPLIRIDLSSGAEGNQFESWNGTEWELQSTESWHGDGDIYGSGYLSNTAGYAYRVHNGTRGFYIEPGNGQFNDGGTGDNSWIYQTKFDSAQGSADLPRLGNCCNNNHMQGPEAFLNGETTEGEDIVLWVVPNQGTVTTYGVGQGLAAEPYCWTEGTNPMTTNLYPCHAGPMFVPFNVTAPTAIGQQVSVSAESPLIPTVVLLFASAIIGISSIHVYRRIYQFKE